MASFELGSVLATNRVAFVVSHCLNDSCPWSPIDEARAELALAADVGLVIEGPKLDITLLLFAIFFFCLAAVFKYGAELQEDSDSIL